MRLFVLAGAAAVASLALNGCASPGFYNGGYGYNGDYYGGTPYAPSYGGTPYAPYYGGTPYAPAAVGYPEYGVPPPEPPPISSYGYAPPRAGPAYGSARPQVYSAPQSAPRYSGAAAYRPQVYSSPPRPSPGDQTYGRGYRP
jgi:hypothetical protein